ncbi:MAG: SHOCT domain-containing protein [Actinobacteria bacterium]|nr:SHOCT domain-containing protein [Actinomycetota bacterium]
MFQCFSHIRGFGPRGDFFGFGWYGQYFPWFLILKMIITILLLVLVAYFVVKLLKREENAFSSQKKDALKVEIEQVNLDALRQLNQKYINKEISEEEYLQMKKSILSMPE